MASFSIPFHPAVRPPYLRYPLSYRNLEEMMLERGLTLTTIARLAVPFLADYCFFDIVNANQQIERVAWHIAEPTMQDWFNQVQRFVPPQNFENHLVASALESGNANVVPEVTEAWMQAAAISAQELQFMRRCQLRSLMTVPLKIEQHQLGALTFCFTTNSNRRYTAHRNLGKSRPRDIRCQYHDSRLGFAPKFQKRLEASLQAGAAETTLTCKGDHWSAQRPFVFI